MINAKELRIGNWVKDADGDFKVLDIECDVDKYWIGINECTSVNAVAIEPIELTEDILIKCGFKKGYTGILQLTDINLNCILEYDEADKSVSVIFEGMPIGQQVKYLHQLQNLCFALTYEELNIELNAPVSDTTKA